MDINRARQKTFSILKQPAYRIQNYLRNDRNISIGVEDIRLIIEDIKSFFNKAYKKVGYIKLIFVIDYNRIGVNKYINSDEVKNEILTLSSKELYYHLIDINGNLLESIKFKDLSFERDNFDQENLEYNDISYFSEYISSTVIYLEGNIYEINHSGRTVEHAAIDGMNIIYGKITKNMKPIENYKELIMDHYEECIRYASACDYWNNKKNRILRDSSEDLFKKSLWYYLDKFSLNTREVSSEYNLPSGNRIDIVAHAENSKLYAFEIKVLGKYQSNNKCDNKEKVHSYGEDRVHHGLIQIKSYLDEAKNIERAVLVVYDARDNQNEIVLNDNEKHFKTDEPLYLFLESESATEKAKIGVKANKHT